MKRNNKKIFSTKQKGWLTENIAYCYLKLLGYTVLDRNFQTKFGELDIVAKKGKIVVIIEVKSRFQKNSWHPLTGIHNKKVQKLNQLTQYYIKVKKLFDTNIRIDAITLEKKFFWFQIKHYKGIINL